MFAATTERQSHSAQRRMELWLNGYILPLSQSLAATLSLALSSAPGLRARRPFLGRERVPHTQALVPRGRDKPRAVGAERDLMDVGAVAAQVGDLLARPHVPQADGVVR